MDILYSHSKKVVFDISIKENGRLKNSITEPVFLHPECYPNMIHVILLITAPDHSTILTLRKYFNQGVIIFLRYKKYLTSSLEKLIFLPCEYIE